MGSVKRRMEQDASQGPAKRFHLLSPQEANLGSATEILTGIEAHFTQNSDTAMEDVIMGDTPTSPMVCYGALFDVKAKTTFIDRAAIPAQHWFYPFRIVKRGASYFMIHPTEESDCEFAVLDVFITSSLNSLSELENISLSGVIAHATLDTVPSSKTENATIIDLTVNISGPESSAQAVGEALAQTSAYLQHPVFLEPDAAYSNPHYCFREGIMTDLRHQIGIERDDSKLSNISKVVEDVLRSLGNTEGLHDAECDVETMSKPFLVNTALTRHQIEGVKFILARENPVFCRNANINFQNRMNLSLDQPFQGCLGGILADFMGLGKTLTMLTAIACSKPAAYGVHKNEAIPTSTLIVLPSKQLLDVWDAEIQKRFQKDYLQVGHFHGDGRAKKSATLLKYDVVLTTYQTLAIDCGGRKLLRNVPWFRVVLDEAHCIRNQNTKLFKATEILRAERRWCITGTPIRNSLQDLRSLLKFLHYEPLQRTGMFEQHIIDPIRKDEGFGNLQLLLRTVCIRRSEQCTSLPPSITEVVLITLSDEESSKYRKILADCQTEFEIEFRKTGVQKTELLFSTIQKLRTICNHGMLPAEMMTSQAPTRRSRNSKRQRLMEIDSCGFCSGEEGTAGLEGFDQCPFCDRWLGNVKQKSVEADGRLSVDPPLSRASSPLSRSPSPMPIESEGSSKLTVVTQHITAACQAFKKSVIFTSWRSTLDTLKGMLSQRGIKSVRVHGNVNAIDRGHRLSRFRDDPQISVLLMTMDSGTAGLTLTNACQVHLVEPQWNPTMEAQAISRVLRMGQTQTVKIFKYVTMNTVEQRIVELQKRKGRIAQVSLNELTQGDNSGVLDDWKFVLDPN